MNTQAWLDGKSITGPAAKAVNADLVRGLAYGDGLFETIGVDSGRAQFLRLHLERLLDGCRRLSIACDEAALRREIATVVDFGVAGVLKIIVVRAGVGRGYASRRHAGSHRLVQFFPQAVRGFFNRQPPAILRLCRQRLGLQPTLAGMKHLNRLEQVLARAEWSDPQIAEGLMLDINAHVIEAVSSNIFCVRDGKVLTPSLHQCGVAGVLRRVVMEYLDISVIEQALTLDDFYRADEVFLTSTLRGIQPVTQLDCVHWQYGSVTIALQQKLEQLLDQFSLSQ